MFSWFYSPPPNPPAIYGNSCVHSHFRKTNVIRYSLHFVFLLLEHAAGANEIYTCVEGDKTFKANKENKMTTAARITAYLYKCARPKNKIRSVSFVSGSLPVHANLECSATLALFT